MTERAAVHIPTEPGAPAPADQGELVTTTLTVNGRRRTVRIRTDQTLLDVLRSELNLFGVRYGCGVGVCGACTVIRGDEAVNSCLVLAALCDNDHITTVEGLGSAGELGCVQERFLEQRAAQCSYCTPGFVMALEALRARDPNPSEEAVREAFTGHICRCGSYSRVMRAARQAVGLAAEEGGEP